MTQPSRDQAEAGTDADDAAVIQLSRQEPEHFNVLFRRHAPYIQRYVVRRIGQDAADDIVAETFLLAFRQRDSYDQTRANARPWLYGIATNLIGHHRRAEIRLYRALARTGADPVTESFTDRIDDQISASTASRRLTAALARLSKDRPDGQAAGRSRIRRGPHSADGEPGPVGVPGGRVALAVSVQGSTGYEH
jgi:RNA polymerase sigma-70 factor, ECF subfamily